MIPFSRVVIAGLGLIGGSCALALRRAFPELAIAAWDDDGVLAAGLERGVIDAVCRPGALGFLRFANDGAACDHDNRASRTA